MFLLFSQSNSLLVIQAITFNGNTIPLEARSSATSAICPHCRTTSTQIHDPYQRQPLDLPWRGYPGLKRKVRDYVAVRTLELPEDDRSGLDIYVKHLGVLNQEHQRAYNALDRSPQNANRETIRDARRWMCQHYYDIRMFGAVMTTRINAGQVRGPVQLTVARSIDTIVPLDLSITRVAVTNLETSGGGRGRGRLAQAAAATAVVEGELDDSKTTEMGRKAIVPYGLYRAHGFFSSHFAQDTGVTTSDLALFWEALQNMWDLDHSASRGSMACRGLYVFSHQNGRGNSPAHRLFERIKVKRNDGAAAPRSFADYTISVDASDLPAGITLVKLVE
jgi:CRISPR-associated protein Csd2